MDNLISFRRFSGVDPNIAQHGITVEELNTGRPDPNPVASPMASPAVPQARLALSRLGSDRVRLAGPESPAVNPYEGPKLTLVLSRNAMKKLHGRVVADLTRLVQGGAVATGNVQGLMSDSLRRVLGMREFVETRNSWADRIQVLMVGAAKG